MARPADIVCSEHPVTLGEEGWWQLAVGAGSLDPVFVALWLWKDENSGQVKMMDGPNLGVR